MTESKQKTNAAAADLANTLAEAGKVEAERAEAVRRNWRDLAHWHFGHLDKAMTQEEIRARLEECLMAVADISAVVARVDIEQVIRDGYPFALHRIAAVTQGLALNGYALLEELAEQSHSHLE